MPFQVEQKLCNRLMSKFIIGIFLFAFLLSGGFRDTAGQSIGAYDLINLINGMRSGNGLGALSVDSSLMACAQSTAETMAASHMTWHIGNVSARASSFGYNNYNTCFATENFTVGSASMTISQVAASWSDASHMIPAQSSSYCHIGAGVATASDGLVYYVVQAAYPAGVAGCGFVRTTGNAGNASNPSASMIIKSVVTATPNEEGMVIHKVDEGQTLWSISEAYNVSIEDLQAWNNMHGSTALSLGQELYIPAKSEVGRTPTPHVDLTVFPTMNSEGKFYHIVEDGDTLWSISELWNIPLNDIYQVNGLNSENSIGLGWEIEIPVTPTDTPTPTETPTLTPYPTETETPTMEISEINMEEPSAIPTMETKEGFLNAPRPVARTYIFMGLFGVVLTGGAVIGGNWFMKKK